MTATIEMYMLLEQADENVCVDSFFFLSVFLCAYLCEPVGEFHGTDGSLQSPRMTEDPIKYA